MDTHTRIYASIIFSFLFSNIILFFPSSHYLIYFPSFFAFQFFFSNSHHSNFVPFFILTPFCSSLLLHIRFTFFLSSFILFFLFSHHSILSFFFLFLLPSLITSFDIISSFLRHNSTLLYLFQFSFFFTHIFLSHFPTKYPHSPFYLLRVIEFFFLLEFLSLFIL